MWDVDSIEWPVAVVQNRGDYLYKIMNVRKISKKLGNIWLSWSIVTNKSIGAYVYQLRFRCINVPEPIAKSVGQGLAREFCCLPTVFDIVNVEEVLQ